ncbi:MAG: hypothetical protein IKJ88_03390 [Clostridia bacterium]|nr:hypothetical protein [Clostridia bacterium]
MKKFKKMMAVLLSVVMVFGSVSVAATAAYSPYLDNAITGQYNTIDKAELTSAQKASLILDDLDDMLEKEDILLDIPVIGTIDLTSIDAALDSIYDITGNWLFGSLTVGDLVVLENNRSAIASVRRASADKTDLDVIASLVTYLSNCAPTLLGMFEDDFNWGIVHGFLPPEFRMIIDDFNGWLDELIWDLIHPVNDETMPDNPTLDYFVQFLCDNQLAGNRTEIMGFEGVMEGFEVNIESDSAYSIIEEGIYEALNAFIIPVLNGDLKTVIREAVESNQADGGELYQLIDVNYVITRYEFDEDLGLMEQINDVLKHAVDEMLLPDQFDWLSNAEGAQLGKTNVQTLTDNLVGLLRTIIEAGGEVENVSQYSLKELGDYIARVAVEQFVKHLDFEVGDTMEKIAYEGLRELVIRFIPEANYPDMPSGTTSAQYRDAVIEMGADIACYYLNANLGLNCPISSTADEFISAFIDWCMPYINGLFDDAEFDEAENGWDKLDAIFWQFIPKEWINYTAMFNNGNGTATDLTVKSLINYIFDTVFAMDINGLFVFFDHIEGGALNAPLRDVLIDFVGGVLNTAFYVTDSNGNKEGIVDLNEITVFEDIINPVSNANDIISGLLKSLAQRPELQETTLNLVVMLMGLADPQSLGDLEIDLASRINCTSGSVPSDTKMRITNYSDGINSGWLPVGATAIDQDKMYEIELVALTNNAGLTASVPAGTKIAANAYYDVTVSGAVTSATEARFDLSYYILDEDGARINNGTPLVKSVYTHLYTASSNYDLTSAEVTANNVTFEDFSTYLYTTDVYNVSLFSILATNKSGLVTSAVDVKRAIVTGTLPAGIAAHAPADGSIVHIDDSSATSATYGTVNPYISTITDPDAEQPYGIYDVNIQFEVQGKGLFGNTTTGTSEARNHKIVIYNDFGLPGVLGDVMDANRQRVDFADDATTEWNNYLGAVSAGFALIDGNPDHEKMFTDVDAELEGVQNDYYVKVEAINAAVAALDAKAKATDSAKLAALNAEIAEYEAVDSDNYILFTYDRFEDAYDRAASLANSQVAPEGEEDTFVAPSIPVFDLVYATQQLNLWGARLIQKTTNKTQLINLVDEAEDLIEAAYTAESWAAFELALNAANDLIESNTALQTEVNDARIELMKKMNDLVKATYIVAASGLNVVIDEANMLILGAPADTTALADVVTATSGFVATCNKSGDYIGTGSTVTITAGTSTTPIATYTVIVFGDLDGDGTVSNEELWTIEDHATGFDTTVIEEDTLAFLAADVDGNGTITMEDVDLLP